MKTQAQLLFEMRERVKRIGSCAHVWDEETRSCAYCKTSRNYIDLGGLKKDCETLARLAKTQEEQKIVD